MGIRKSLGAIFVMYIEKKIIKNRPYYYLRRKMQKAGRQTTDTAAYLGQNFLVAYLKFFLIKLGVVKPSS